MTRYSHANRESYPDLLLTKLYIPQAHPQLVSREHLIARLNEGLTLPFILISAPPGFGKTTILSEWISQTNVRAAWLSLDDGDNDLQRFWHYLIAALERVESSLGASAQTMLLAAQPVPVESILTILSNDIALDSEDLTLVLDDYHMINDPAIHHSFNFFLDHMPLNMHLVVATRTDPPLPSLSRLRARGELVELRITDLRFSPREAADFLNRVMGLELSVEDIAALERRTEGWIAGLQLAAIGMRASSDSSLFIKAFAGSHRFVLDYLSDQVLQQQSNQIQEFLLQTSILERLSAALCNAVTGISDSQTILERLERQNLFVIALDDERNWYRYHHLFADMLQHRLRQSQPEHVTELHHKASVWYESQDLLDQAIKHALSGGEDERAALLVETRAEKLIDHSQLGMLLPWLKALRPDLIRTHPKLCSAYALALLSAGQLDSVERLLQDAEQGVPRTSAETQSDQWLGETDAIAKVIRAILAFVQGNTVHAIDLSQQAVAQLPGSASFMRNLAAWNLGNAYWQKGDLDGASETYTKLASASRAGGDLLTSLIAQYYLAQLQSEQGRLSEAFTTHERALSSVSEDNPASGFPVVGMAQILSEWNDFDTALRYLAQAIELGKQAGNVVILLAAYETLARIRWAQGDVSAAFEAINQAEQLFIGKPFQNPAYHEVLAYRAQLWIWQGNLGEASNWVRAVDVHQTDELNLQYKAEYLTLARLLIARREPESALRLLARLIERVESDGRLGWVIECLVLEAVVQVALASWQEARLTLVRALSLAEPGGYIRTFVDEGEPIHLLISDIRLQIEKGKDHNAGEILLRYLDILLAAFGNRPGRILRLPIHHLSRPTVSIGKSEVLVEPLSERELAVLKLIFAGFSNREIADRLFIEIGTVKTHINNIYGKLDVHSRTQAVARARDLNLL